MKTLEILYFSIFFISWFVCLYQKGKGDRYFDFDKLEIFLFCLIWPVTLMCVALIYITVPMFMLIEWLANIPYELGRKRKEKEWSQP